MYNGTVVINFKDHEITGRVTSIEFEPVSIGEVMRGNVSFVADDLKKVEEVTKKPEKEEYNWRYE